MSGSPGHIQSSKSTPGLQGDSDSMKPSDDPGVPDETDASCLWRQCGKRFPHMSALLEHVDQDHTAPAGSKYTCEWASCAGRGRQQHSRSALISHIRSHITKGAAQCTECDCSFERPDSLQRHMRAEHGQAGLRRSSRKRKRANEDNARPLSPNNHTFYAFRVDTGKPRGRPPRRQAPNPHAGNATAGPLTLQIEPSPSPPPNKGSISASDAAPARPHYTREELERSPEMVRYILMKAKYRYALEQHEALTDELELARAELERQRTEKDFALDKLLHDVFGSDADAYINPPELKRAEEKVAARDGRPLQHSPSPGVELMGPLPWHGPPGGLAAPRS